MGKSPLELLTDALFIGVILALIVINLKSLLLPNKITYSGLALAMIARLFLPNLSSFGLLDQALFSKLPRSLVSIDGAIIGAIIGGGSLLLVRWGWKRLRGVEASKAVSCGLVERADIDHASQGSIRFGTRHFLDP